MVLRLKNLTYKDRLRESNLLSLEQRRGRGNMIVIYKIMIDNYHLDREDS